MQSFFNTPALGISRRAIFRSATLFAGGAALFGTSLTAWAASAQTKLSQKAILYQDTPKGKSRCDNCTQWQPPASCKIVEGQVAAAGWCNLYAFKS